MITIEKIDTYGWEAAIRGMRNPKNSWERSDSIWPVDDSRGHDICNNCVPIDKEKSIDKRSGVYLGDADHKLMATLASGGPVHAKYRRMIIVSADITAPLYWWKEFDTYKVGTVANSCSTMHKIAAKKFTLDDFSHEHLFGRGQLLYPNSLSSINIDGQECYFTPREYMQHTCDILNRYRELFLETKDKLYWWQMIQLLPSSYNQRRTVMLNYEVLHNIYISRKDHKLDEWHTFCNFIKSLPHSELIIGE